MTGYTAAGAMTGVVRVGALGRVTVLGISAPGFWADVIEVLGDDDVGFDAGGAGEHCTTTVTAATTVATVTALVMPEQP